jgi:hypothetical protein
MTIPLNALRLTLLVCAATMTVLTGGCGQKNEATGRALVKLAESVVSYLRDGK